MVPCSVFSIFLACFRNEVAYLAILRGNTQEADSPNCSTLMPKVVVGVPQVLKVFSWGFNIYISQKNWFGPQDIGENRLVNVIYD